MGTRHRGRERAIQCLYQWETTGAALDRMLPGFWRAQQESEEVREFTERLVRGTVENTPQIDTLIDRQADNWRIDRMGKVDQSILRLGVYELMFEDDTPAAVVIDEAIELAKRFSGETAGPFVNGVLDGIRQRLEKGETNPTMADGGEGPSE